MIDRKLADYVKKYINAGYDRNQLRQTLVNSGWPHDQVDAAIDHALSKHPPPYPHGEIPKGPSIPSTPQQKPMGVLRKFKTVLFHPREFFEAVKSEQGYETPVRFYLFLALIQMVMLNLVVLAAVSIDPSAMDPGLGFGTVLAMVFSNLIFTNIFVLVAVAITFVSAGYLHVFVRLFGGRGRYQNTYKLTVYSAAPVAFLLLSLPAALISPYIVMVVAVITSLWAFIIQVTGLARLHGMTPGRIALMILTMIFVTAVVAFIVAAVIVAVFLLPFILSLYTPPA
ncbi:MAG: YIP1 family protein [Candidatus Aenigmarchaeota archaeon]|nr:YIP1 family protein [Candidatus Aenigmarchaeota archaeon]